MGREVGVFLVFVAALGRMNGSSRKQACHTCADRLPQPLLPCWTVRNRPVVAGPSAGAQNRAAEASRTILSDSHDHNPAQTSASG